VESVQGIGISALIIACEEGHLGVVKDLLANGASTSFQTVSEGATGCAS
jgi:hypothetical protein